VYFSCGSTSTSTRFATLRDVIVKGEAGVVNSTRAVRNSALQVYPNPAAEQLTLTHPAAASGAQVVVYTLLGQRVRELPCTLGARETQVNLQGLSSGQYMLQYVSGGQHFTTPIIKQ
jgi:pectinesterase